MTRLQDFALGAGICTLLLALVACAVQMVLEVLAVERDRRKVGGRGQSESVDAAEGVSTPAPPAAVVLSEDPASLPDDVFAETVRRAHPDLTEWAS